MNWQGIKMASDGVPYVPVSEANAALAQVIPWLPFSAWWFAIPLVIATIVVWFIVGYPIWNVWASHKDGQADLQRARNEQQIQIAKAQSRLDAAALNKQAAIVEAEAVAEQIQRIGNQLTTHDLFLRWQWIKMMEDRDGETIYVPTEANLPILEATRR